MLRVEHVSHAYGGANVLVDICFSVRRGSVTGIIGPNGSGKSTLLNIISGILKPNAGGVWWGDVDLTHLPPHAVSRHGVARLFQRTQLSGDLNAYANISVGIYKSHTKMGLRWSAAASGLIEDAAAACGLGRKQLGAYPRDLSFFEQRMVELARCLVAQPSLLLLDEPTSGFTDEERQRAAQAINRLTPNVTILLVEHDVDLVHRLSDHLIVLADGRVLTTGPPTIVLSDETVTEAYLGKAYVTG
jgi:branched-chain amino acid transport system ATP-binding protein